jgi:hypothetical protein
MILLDEAKQLILLLRFDLSQHFVQGDAIDSQTGGGFCQVTARGFDDPLKQLPLLRRSDGWQKRHGPYYPRVSNVLLPLLVYDKLDDPHPFIR